jgi:dTMP kinase
VLITMEGVEGSGKSTQIQRLAARLERCGIDAVLTKEPGGTALCQEIRALLLQPHGSGETWAPLAELLLFYADRAQHLARCVEPALRAGKVVLLDRFDDSTRAYQGAQGIPETHLDQLRDLVLAGRRPDLTVVLDLDPVLSLERVAARNGADAGFRETRFDQEALAFHVEVRRRFQELARREPGRVVLVPALGGAEDVEAAVWARVAPVLAAAGFRTA